MDDMVSAEQARELLEGYDASHWRDLARTVAALHERLAAVEAERDGALAQCETLTTALRETQRARDVAAQAFDDLVATVWRAATGDEHEPPGSTGALVESVQALRAAADSVVRAQIDCDDPRDEWDREAAEERRSTAVAALAVALREVTP